MTAVEDDDRCACCLDLSEWSLVRSEGRKVVEQLKIDLLVDRSVNPELGLSFVPEGGIHVFQDLLVYLGEGPGPLVSMLERLRCRLSYECPRRDAVAELDLEVQGERLQVARCYILAVLDVSARM